MKGFLLAAWMLVALMVGAGTAEATHDNPNPIAWWKFDETKCNIAGATFQSLDPVFGLLIALAFVFALVGVLFIGVFSFRRRRSA